MDSFWNITIGEILTIAVALLALIFATIVGIRQNKISNILLKQQNIVEIYISYDFITSRAGEATPCMCIRNLSSGVIYLNRYLFNGTEYPLYNQVLPGISQYDAFRYICLPTDGRIHASFEIFFSSWAQDKWETKGYADFVDGEWKFTYQPCVKSVNK